ncbi:hypothetical protein [Absicoccus intestinalis]|uniref:Uncharacterized protein n=1 Tax=Absicoccus intestinalis TaxID=2926319 RepID=A0ABU4WKN8_9FIRM|nr:hypothetical protein [Absicoccus sp. CLA-KB-P134]MDX8417124.1 hypothetical protein [Absicoccus sp. CLA-KB-P134]
MMLLESEKRWISENMSNANEVLSMSDPNDIITELALYSVSKMDKDDNPTEKTYEAEKIMDRLADDDDWPEWDGS